MLILLSLIAYLVIGVPFVAWLAHRLARASRDDSVSAAADATPTPEAVQG
jgi:hypothetical protein